MEEDVLIAKFKALHRNEDVITSCSQYLRDLCVDDKSTSKACSIAANIINGSDANSESKFCIFLVFHHIYENASEQQKALFQFHLIHGFLHAIASGFQNFGEKLKPRVLKVLGTWMATGVVSYQTGQNIYKSWTEGLSNPPSIVFPPNFVPPVQAAPKIFPELPESPPPSSSNISPPTDSTSSSMTPAPVKHTPVPAPAPVAPPKAPSAPPSRSNALTSSHHRNILEDEMTANKVVMKFGGMNILKGKPRQWELRKRLIFSPTLPALLQHQNPQVTSASSVSGVSGGHFPIWRWQAKTVVSEDSLYIQRMGFIAACVESNIAASTQSGPKAGSRGGNKQTGTSAVPPLPSRRSTRQRVVREDLLRGESSAEDSDSSMQPQRKRAKGGSIVM
eukprot:GDKJ01025808.1.p1 GENE.GDKJ01025808.1~~GDKJ01025808.1.p1  ORF type:complete len:391 (-),score=67.97 GDKJ01025808.1:24-1196(-)